jgi:hypothetical protein
MVAGNTEAKSKRHDSKCHQSMSPDTFAKFSLAEKRLVSALVHVHFIMAASRVEVQALGMLAPGKPTTKPKLSS